MTTNPTLMLNLGTLAKRLEIPSYQTRTDGSRIVLIAGAAGHVRADLSLHIRISALSPEAKGAAADLLDAGCLGADAGGQLFVRRLPDVGAEARLFRTMLGLFHHLERRAAL